MALVTGRDCDLTIGGKPYAGIVNRYELSFDSDSQTYDTLSGPLAVAGSESGTLAVTFAYDSGATDSLFDALWTAADAGTNVQYVATVGSSTFTGEAVPKRPNAAAVAGEVSEVSVDLTLSGMPTKGTAAARSTATASK
jgi:hypothetical protein